MNRRLGSISISFTQASCTIFKLTVNHFIKLYLDWTLTHHLMKLVSPPSNNNIKEKQISHFCWKINPELLAHWLIFTDWIYLFIICFLFWLLAVWMWGNKWFVSKYCENAGYGWNKVFCGLGEMLPVTANFHQNWIKMIQQWGEVILISYSLSEEFKTESLIKCRLTGMCWESNMCEDSPESIDNSDNDGDEDVSWVKKTQHRREGQDLGDESWLG